MHLRRPGSGIRRSVRRRSGVCARPRNATATSSPALRVLGPINTATGPRNVGSGGGCRSTSAGLAGDARDAAVDDPVLRAARGSRRRRPPGRRAASTGPRATATGCRRRGRAGRRSRRAGGARRGRRCRRAAPCAHASAAASARVSTACRRTTAMPSGAQLELRRARDEHAPRGRRLAGADDEAVVVVARTASGRAASTRRRRRPARRWPAARTVSSAAVRIGQRVDEAVEPGLHRLVERRRDGRRDLADVEARVRAFEREASRRRAAPARRPAVRTPSVFASSGT